MKKSLNLLAFIAVTTALLFSCKTLKEVDKSMWDSEKYILEAQKLSNKERYKKAIEMLEEMTAALPGQDEITLNYLIGFNYYNLKQYDKAKTYFETVKVMFESRVFTEIQREEYKKFVVLADSLLSKIEEDQGTFDPYHIQEDLKKNKKIRPKKDEPQE